mgnify:CR=1 FL=1|jgi:hypothetical protein
MTCREEVLAAMRRLHRRHRRDIFSPVEIIQEVKTATDRYPESTIRTHVCAHLCRQVPDHCSACYEDLDRVGYGLYRLY